MSKSRLIPVGVFKHDMRALVDWLRSHRIQQVAMESTGIYGKSVFSHVEPAGVRRWSSSAVRDSTIAAASRPGSLCDAT
jgi:purine-nucleoside phosphorylase